MKDKRLLVSFILNLVIFSFVLTGTIVAFIVGDGVLAAAFPDILKYFTFQSNIFMGVVALIYAYYQYLLLIEKKDKIPHVLNVFYHVGVTAVALTFVIVIFFLAPGYGFDKMYRYANLFFHGLAPVVAIANYMFFSKECRIRFVDTLFAIIPSLLYGIVYFIVVVSNNAYGDINIDFYMFGKDGPWIGAINFLSVMAIAYVMGLLVYFVNRLVFKKAK